MAKFLITLSNTGGTLDQRTADTEEEARQAAIEMLTEAAYLSAGDTISVIDTSE